jgi:hypothetical protein
MLCEFSENNKSLGAWELNRFINMESAVLKSQNPPYKFAGKLFDFLHIRQMLLLMYLGHYQQESVQEKYPESYGNTGSKQCSI